MLDSLNNYSFVIVKDNATKHHLQPTYSGSYKVIKHSGNYFIITINNK